MKSLLAIAFVLLCGRIECQSNISTALTELGCVEFLQLLNSTGKLEELEDLDEVTLFAPTDEAINAGKLPDGDELDALLKYHAIESHIQYSDITNEGTNVSFSGAQIRFNVYNRDLVKTAQGAQLVKADSDVNITKGLIHVVNAVMFPPSETIYQLISNNDTFSILTEAIDAVPGLDEALNGTEPYTIFAPTNDAFNNIPDLDALLKNETGVLTDVLYYHGTVDTHFSADLNKNDEFTTLQGDNITIVIDTNGIYINDIDNAEITNTDLSVTNGVVHVIDRVLKMDVRSGSTALSIQISLIVGCLAIIISVLKL